MNGTWLPTISITKAPLDVIQIGSSQSDTHISPFIFIFKISKQLGGGGEVESTDGFATTTVASLVRAKDDSGFVKWYLLAFPPSTFFWGVFLFCAINLSLEIFKKSSYNLFDFFFKSGFSYFCVLELILGFKIMGSLIFLKKLRNPVDF
jgi:hypothetical protein